MHFEHDKLIDTPLRMGDQCRGSFARTPAVLSIETETCAGAAAAPRPATIGWSNDSSASSR